jgi:septal ring-binding cell division protein DamX
VITLVLTYLRMPGEEDALYRSTFRGVADGNPIPAVPAASAAPVSALSPVAGDSEKPGDASATGPAAARTPALTGVRRFPLWGPGNGSLPTPPGTPTGRAADPPPDFRNVESVSPPSPAGDGAGARVTAPAESSGVPEPPAQESLSPFVYRIQVRAKESMAGAQSIVEYLGLFGFDKPLIEGDLRGDRNASGEKLYTVFVGKYANEAEARRECERLKSETRQRPYKNREEFFESSLVITRKR